MQQFESLGLLGFELGLAFCFLFFQGSPTVPLLFVKSFASLLLFFLESGSAPALLLFESSPVLSLFLLCLLEPCFLLESSLSPHGLFLGFAPLTSLVLFGNSLESDFFFHRYLPLPGLFSLKKTLLAEDFFLFLADAFFLGLFCTLFLSCLSGFLLALSILLLLTKPLCLFLLSTQLFIPFLLLLKGL